MKVIDYTTLNNLNPICPERIRKYPELAAVRDATPEERRHMHPGDLEDAQHQWAYTDRLHVLQTCLENECDAVRATPLDGYDTTDQMFLLQEFIRTQLNHPTINTVRQT